MPDNDTDPAPTGAAARGATSTGPDAACLSPVTAPSRAAACRRTPPRWQGAVVAAPLAAGLAALLWLGPIHQPLDYHQFADQHTLFGIPRFGDVVTNLPFIAIGLFGLACLRPAGGAGRPDPRFGTPGERLPYALFFLGLFLTGLGSTWYHLAPDSDSLVWDRLPITAVFTSLFAIVIAERVGPRLGVALSLPLLVVGAATVLYWHFTDDLRPYGIVQFYPMVAVPLLIFLYPARYTRAGHIWGVLAWYAAAKTCEGLDRPIAALLGGVVSGHNLKHCLAAVSTAWLLVMLHGRRPVAAAPAVAAPGPVLAPS